MKYLKSVMSLMAVTILFMLYIMAKMQHQSSQLKGLISSTHLLNSPELEAEIKVLNAEITALIDRKHRLFATGDNWRPFPNDVVKQISAVKVHATNLVVRLGCPGIDADLWCSRILYWETHLGLDLANNDIKVMRKHAIEAKSTGDVETGLAVVDNIVNKYKPPPFLRDLAYTGTGYLKMIVLREAIERFAAFFRFGPRINVLGNNN